MMLIIKKNAFGYHIALIFDRGKCATGIEEICKFLNIDKDFYLNLLLSHGAKDLIYLLVFKRIEAANTVMKKLEPYIVMAKLNEGELK